MESVASGSCCVLRCPDLNSQQHGAMGPVAHDDQIVPDSSSWSSSSPNSTGFTYFDSFLQMQVIFIDHITFIILYVDKQVLQATQYVLVLGYGTFNTSFHHQLGLFTQKTFNQQSKQPQPQSAGCRQAYLQKEKLLSSIFLSNVVNKSKSMIIFNYHLFDQRSCRAQGTGHWAVGSHKHRNTKISTFSRPPCRIRVKAKFSHPISRHYVYLILIDLYAHYNVYVQVHVHVVAKQPIMMR